MHHQIWLYVIFAVVLLASMGLDLYQHKRDKAVSISSALKETLFWIGVAVVFGGVVFLFEGKASTIDYFSGYLLEKSLSVDNLFVMIAIFTSFAIPEKYRHRVLYFGILGAIVLRFIFISLGSMLLSLGEFVLIIF
jgi:tellurite resistance protein TerC